MVNTFKLPLNLYCTHTGERKEILQGVPFTVTSWIHLIFLAIRSHLSRTSQQQQTTARAELF